jgi:hypothetical protein
VTGGNRDYALTPALYLRMNPFIYLPKGNKTIMSAAPDLTPVSFSLTANLAAAAPIARRVAV